MIKKVFSAYGMMKKIIREAYISISAYKTRTFLTMLGIIIGVAAVVIMVSAGQTVQNQITATFDSMGTNLIIISPAQTVSGGVRGGRGKPSVSFEDVESLKELKYVSPTNTLLIQLSPNSLSWTKFVSEASFMTPSSI